MNVLVTSASRKVWLVDAFRRAVAATGGGRVVAVDTDRLAPALYAADAAATVPPLDDPAFEPALDRLIATHEIGLVVPTRDGELPWFAARADHFAERGVHVAVSPLPAVVTCLDKAQFDIWCRSHTFPVPRRLGHGSDPGFPVVVKPRHGSGARGVVVALDQDALDDARRADPDAIVQELVVGVEHTVDVAAGLDGRILGTVVRRRVRVETGESVVGVTVHRPAIESLARTVTTMLGLRGAVTVQVFERPDGTPCLVEVNPRFGGGAALGIAAGLDTPSLLVRSAQGEFVTPPGMPRIGLAMLRHGSDIFLPEDDLCAG
jgi:carbamoyl-phosphate synthase large subunit